MVLTFGQSFFFFHPQIQYLRQSAHNGKLLELQECRRTKSEPISMKMETQAHGKSLEKSPDRRRPHRTMSDLSPNLRLAGVGQVRKGHRAFQLPHAPLSHLCPYNVALCYQGLCYQGLQLIWVKCVLWSNCMNPEEANKGKSRLPGATVKGPTDSHSERTGQITLQGMHSLFPFSIILKPMHFSLKT